ncbi:MAG TPA: DUF6510 family protein [Gemmatimonadaceae bacterium]|jgi:hypothetical protein
MQVEDMRLDGNAAAGTLREIFALDVTAALAQCACCGTVAPMGALLEYGHGMGVILRCSSCEAAVVRIARTPGWIRLDVSGIAFLSIPDSPASA